MKKFTFIWSIENYSYNWHNEFEKLESPTFFVEIMQQTSWKLLLNPRGTHDDPDFIILYLNECDEDIGQDEFPLNCELSILDAKGRDLALEEFKNDECRYGEAFRFIEFFERPHYILKDGVITPDVLRVCCRMSVDEGEVDGETVCYAKTRIGLEKISFVHTIEHFASRNPNREEAPTTFVSDGRLVISGTVNIRNDPASDDEVVVEISLHSPNARLITCQIYLLNSTGKEVEWGRIDTRNDVRGEPILSTSMNFGRDLLDKKREYLANDKLTLRCECMLSTGIEFQGFEDAFHDLHLTPLLKEKISDTKFALPTPDPKSALGDFRTLYKDRILSDVQLVTASKTFPAHKSVLCARSLVFSRRLRTNNVAEKWGDCIKIEDLDDSTIDQFLHFLYTDTLEDLQWESAMKLYLAAKEYQVQRLKDVCTSFLITQLNRRNMKDVLILADTHKDSDLKTAVENFIVTRHLKIFSTAEGKTLRKTHCRLAAKALHCYLKSKK